MITSSKWVSLNMIKTKPTEFAEKMYNYLIKHHSFHDQKLLKENLIKMERQRKELSTLFSSQQYHGENNEKTIIEYCQSLEQICLLIPKDIDIAAQWEWECSATQKFEKFQSISQETAAVYYNLGVFQYRWAEQLTRIESQSKQTIMKLRGSWWAFQQTQNIVRQEQGKANCYDLSLTNLNLIDSYIAGLTQMITTDKLNHQHASAIKLSGYYFESGKLFDQAFEQANQIINTVTTNPKNISKQKKEFLEKQKSIFLLSSKRVKGFASYLLATSKYKEVKYEDTADAQYKLFAEVYCLISQAKEVTDLNSEALQSAGIIDLRKQILKTFEEYTKAKDYVYKIHDWPKSYDGRYELMPVGSSPQFQKYYPNKFGLQIRDTDVQERAKMFRQELDVKIQKRKLDISQRAYTQENFNETMKQIVDERQSKKYQKIQIDFETLQENLKNDFNCLKNYQSYQEGFAQNYDTQVSQINQLRQKNQNLIHSIQDLQSEIQEWEELLRKMLQLKPLGDLIKQSNENQFYKDVQNLKDKADTSKHYSNIEQFFLKVLNEDYEFLIFALTTLNVQPEKQIHEQFENQADELIQKLQIQSLAHNNHSDKLKVLLVLQSQTNDFINLLKKIEIQLPMLTKRADKLKNSVFQLALEYKQKTDAAYCEVKNKTVQCITSSKIIFTKLVPNQTDQGDI